VVVAMKLTLAMGLQYDSNKPASLYALSVGGSRSVKSSEPIPEVLPNAPLVAASPVGAWLTLTYNLHGIPVMQSPTALIDLFA